MNFISTIPFGADVGAGRTQFAEFKKQHAIQHRALMRKNSSLAIQMAEKETGLKWGRWQGLGAAQIGILSRAYGKFMKQLDGQTKAIQYAEAATGLSYSNYKTFSAKQKSDFMRAYYKYVAGNPYAFTAYEAKAAMNMFNTGSM
jgi:hypothetical protein